MSQENVEVVRRMIDHLNETGEAGPLDLFDTGVTFTTRGGVEGKRTFTGHAGIADAVAMFGEVWSQTTAHIVEVNEGDGVVVAILRFEVRSQTGMDLEGDEAWAYWVRDGKVTRIEQHGSKPEALEAAGLRE